MDERILPTSLILWAILHITYGGERLIASTCFKNPNKTLNISCPADQLIFIHRSFYGYSHTGSCQYRSGDCTMVQQEQYRCVGQHNCDINLPSSDHGRYIDSCKESSTYFQVEYECIPGDQVVNVCEQKLLTSQTGYIRSPNYPNSYPPSQKCELEVRLGVGQQVDLFAMDINLENGGNTTSDCIYLHDNFRSLTVCGHRYDEHIFKSYQNIVRLTFQSNESHQKKGFWLYYKAIPMRSTTTTTTTTTPTPSTVSTASSTVASTTKQPLVVTEATNNKSGMSVSELPLTDTDRTVATKIMVHRSRHTANINRREEENLPMGAIIGGVLGSLLFILMVLLILLIIRRRREKLLMASLQHNYDVQVNANVAQVQNNINLNQELYPDELWC